MGDADEDIETFWRVASMRAKLNISAPYLGPTPLDAVRPPAWAFGATPQQADDLLALVLAGTKSATAGALWDYETCREPLPEVGGLAIVLDSHGIPHALIVTTSVSVAPFDEVDAEHAYLEGEGDRSLGYWREVHREFFTVHAEHDKGFSEDMPVVLERFRLLYRHGGEDPAPAMADAPPTPKG